MATKQFDGRSVVRWLGSATHEKRSILIHTEYSDDDDIWTIHGVGTSTLMVCRDSETKSISRPFDFFSHGTFFLEEESARLLAAEIAGTMSAAELRISKAIDFENISAIYDKGA